MVGFFEVGLSFVVNIFQSCFGDSLGNQLLAVDVSDWVDVLDDCVHQWLGKGRLVKFVVTHLAVADQVDDDIRAETLAILGGNTESVGDIIH